MHFLPKFRPSHAPNPEKPIDTPFENAILNIGDFFCQVLFLAGGENLCVKKAKALHLSN